MKRITLLLTIMTALLVCKTVFSDNSNDPPDSWTMGKASCWGRNKDSVTLSESPSEIQNGSPVRRVDYTGVNDWAVTPMSKPIPVQAGEVWEISCDVKVKGDGRAQIGVVAYDNSEVVHWNYGEKTISDSDGWKRLTSRFVIERNVTSIQPRLTGVGSSSVWFANYTAKRIDRLELPTEDKILTIENAAIRGEFHTLNGALDVTDKRSGLVWRQNSVNARHWVFRSRKVGQRKIAFDLFLTNVQNVVSCTFEIDEKKPEILFTLDAADKSQPFANLGYPYPFQPKPGDRIIVPMNEGISYPVEEPNIHLSLVTYGGHGICMAFWGVSRTGNGDEALSPNKLSSKIPTSNLEPTLSGVMEDVFKTPDNTSESAYMAIYETPDDARLEVRPFNTNETGLLSAGAVWESQKGALGMERKLRYIFFDGSDNVQAHVAICKRYREYVKQTGLWVPFDEKVRRNPALADGFDRLIGAVNVWCMGGAADKVQLVKDMQAAGIKRILWSGGGNESEIKAMNELPGVLTSRYDIFQDIMDPAREPELPGWHGGWIKEAWPDDIMLDKNGVWVKGWTVTPKDKTKPRIPCGVLCDSKAPEYARKRLTTELASIPYKARFIDTTTASPWRECYSPNHPLTRTESKVWKMRLLGLMGKEFNLVCGSETGHDASVPYCDFYEGMMSLGPYRVPEAGRNMVQIWDEVPERVAKFQLGESYRLPLWELVYHDCTVSYWYWGDYNNKLPSLWDKRDLFNALYGVPPMFMFTYQYWLEHKDRFVQSYQLGENVWRSAGRSEMLDHRILSPDRAVQQTVFADGTTVIVNFGSNDFKTSDGKIIPAGKAVIEQILLKQ
ncbi:MAG: hypothetical protein IJG38_05730 [Thermoguttaceae bacterium]|nr:hypothetical protein [Thermoguttaceae bacterium]